MFINKRKIKHTANIFVFVYGLKDHPVYWGGFVVFWWNFMYFWDISGDFQDEIFRGFLTKIWSF
jgi:hypothetical protein